MTPESFFGRPVPLFSLYFFPEAAIPAILVLQNSNHMRTTDYSRKYSTIQGLTIPNHARLTYTATWGSYYKKSDQNASVNGWQRGLETNPLVGMRALTFLQRLRHARIGGIWLQDVLWAFK